MGGSSPYDAFMTAYAASSSGPQTFHIGDIVEFRGELCPIANIFSGGTLIIEYDNGWRRQNSVPAGYVSQKRDCYWQVSGSEVRLIKNGAPAVDSRPKPKKFELKELDPLVIQKEVKEEIVAVLKQQKNHEKMFKEWGLGEVIEYGRGMTFLFYGPPGTGKTWAATCIGKVFGMDLLSIGAAEIQSSEPGGANRNIQNAFKAARDENKILFIDECDSLVTSREDVGMILGGEINTLLTEIEKHEGIAILATNRIENLDEALERRISLIVEFPHPTFEQREAIWTKLIPKKMPLADDVTFAKLAEFNLTGGQIKNVVLQAARLALSEDAKKVGLSHFQSAIDRTLKSKSLMGTASRYRQIVVPDDFKRTS